MSMDRSVESKQNCDYSVVGVGLGPVPFPHTTSSSFNVFLHKTETDVQSPHASSPYADTPSPPKSSCTRRRRDDPDRVRRPRNCFMMFRSYFVKIHKGESSQTDLSKKAAAVWRLMSKDERRPYEEMAANDDQIHKLQHPHYKFTPKQGRNGSKVNSSRVKSHVVPVPNTMTGKNCSTPSTQQGVHPVDLAGSSTIHAAFPATFGDTAGADRPFFLPPSPLPALNAGAYLDYLFPSLNNQYTTVHPYTSVFTDVTAYTDLPPPVDFNAPYFMQYMPSAPRSNLPIEQLAITALPDGTLPINPHVGCHPAGPSPLGAFPFDEFPFDAFTLDAFPTDPFSLNCCASNQTPLTTPPFATHDEMYAVDQHEDLFFSLSEMSFPNESFASDDFFSVDPELFLSQLFPTLGQTSTL